MSKPKRQFLAETTVAEKVSPVFAFFSWSQLAGSVIVGELVAVAGGGGGWWGGGGGGCLCADSVIAVE